MDDAGRHTDVIGGSHRAGCMSITGASGVCGRLIEVIRVADVHHPVVAAPAFAEEDRVERDPSEVVKSSTRWRAT